MLAQVLKACFAPTQAQPARKIAQTRMQRQRIFPTTVNMSQVHKFPYPVVDIDENSDAAVVLTRMETNENDDNFALFRVVSCSLGLLAPIGHYVSRLLFPIDAPCY